MNKNIRVTKSEEIENGFPSRLKQLRLQNGFSQKEIAELVGLHSIHYGRYERGGSRPSADKLTKLADALGVSVDFLLDGETEDATFANLEDKDLLKMFSKIEKLPAKDKEVVKTLLDAFLKKKEIEDLVTS